MDTKFKANEEKKIVLTRPLNFSNIQVRKEAPKRKSDVSVDEVNEAVKSLDIALNRLKKSKLVNIDDTCSRQNTAMHNGGGGVLENASKLSLNFSKYELLRNVSRMTTSRGDGSEESGGSDTSVVTCTNRLKRGGARDSAALRDQHVERYFRSLEMWLDEDIDTF